MDRIASQLALTARFRKAYGRKCREELQATTTADFLWQQHDGDTPDELPTGRVQKGADGFLEVLKWRSDHWDNVEYLVLEERTSGNIVGVRALVEEGDEEWVNHY